MRSLVNKADFERLLSTRSTRRSAHFALHHLGEPPAPRKRREPRPSPAKLSTAPAPFVHQPVDDLLAGVWFGCVMPKRHARRAVTRNLLKRQARTAFEQHAARLGNGMWLLRLRQPFSPAAFVSARSVALARAARGEIDTLLAQASP